MESNVTLIRRNEKIYGFDKSICELHVRLGSSTGLSNTVRNS
jgi:hypothetical protein